MTSSKLARREFLKRLAALSSLGTAAPLALNLAGIGAASAQTAGDYRALVCLFLSGGNDHYNMVMPYDATQHAEYAAARGGVQSAGGLAYDRAALAATRFAPATAQANGGEFAFCPSMAALHGLYQGKKLAVLANVGPLVAPTNRDQYRNASVPLPPKLFSHNDQQAAWQAYAAEGVRQGWGGRMGDLLAGQNANSVFTAVSAAGNTTFLAGNHVVQYQVGSAGVTKIGALASRPFGIPASAGNAPMDALRSIVTDDMGSSASYLERDHAGVVRRSVGAADLATAAFASAPTSAAGLALPTSLTNSRLAQQLQVVARMIAARGVLGARRQVFFVAIGGFDTHDDQVNLLQDRSGAMGLHGQVGQSIEYFHNAMVAQGVADSVTLFTASDFGRTLTSNGDGSDHGWGAHHFVVGGAVKGGDIYGSMPPTRLHTSTTANPQDAGSGRLIPTTSVDQLAATLGSWFGVAQADLSLIAPNLGNFAPNLGFMA